MLATFPPVTVDYVFLSATILEARHACEPFRNVLPAAAANIPVSVPLERGQLIVGPALVGVAPSCTGGTCCALCGQILLNVVVPFPVLPVIFVLPLGVIQQLEVVEYRLWLMADFGWGGTSMLVLYIAWVTLMVI